MNLDLAVQVSNILQRRFEGLYLRPYLCPAGIPSIGYGATYYEDGTRVTLTDQAITKGRAEQLLQFHVRTVYLPGVLKLCPGIDNPDRLAAIIDFAFNLGLGALKTSTMRKKINASQWEAVPSELAKWIMAAGRILKGLVARRQAEADLVGYTSQGSRPIVP